MVSGTFWAQGLRLLVEGFDLGIIGLSSLSPRGYGIHLVRSGRREGQNGSNIDASNEVREAEPFTNFTGELDM